MSDSWYKVDNVAKVFLATASQRDPRVFRVTLHRGLFWHYFESTDLVPTAQPENKAPCAPLYTPERRNKLIYRVTYFGARINLKCSTPLPTATAGCST